MLSVSPGSIHAPTYLSFCFLGCMICLYVGVCFVLPWTVESFPFMLWRWRNKLKWAPFEHVAPSSLLWVRSWLHPFKGHCEQKAMRYEGVIYVAGHPLLNMRCTRLPGYIRLRNDLYCVEWGVKLYSLTHSSQNNGPKDRVCCCSWGWTEPTLCTKTFVQVARMLLAVDSGRLHEFKGKIWTALILMVCIWNVCGHIICKIVWSSVYSTLGCFMISGYQWQHEVSQKMPFIT